MHNTVQDLCQKHLDARGLCCLIFARAVLCQQLAEALGHQGAEAAVQHDGAPAQWHRNDIGASGRRLCSARCQHGAACRWSHAFRGSGHIGEDAAYLLSSTTARLRSQSASCWMCRMECCGGTFRHASVEAEPVEQTSLGSRWDSFTQQGALSGGELHQLGTVHPCVHAFATVPPQARCVGHIMASHPASFMQEPKGGADVVRRYCLARGSRRSTMHRALGFESKLGQRLRWPFCLLMVEAMSRRG
mmetsp:Transcript_39206/g.92305  ORF Transcript_39206/g.92305 Transcript_39206/m.92305 type:complete len:246 (-) Transcript_39206:2093-2830(-)